MELSAFELYWILKLDDILIGVLLFGVCAGINFLVWCFIRVEQKKPITKRNYSTWVAIMGCSLAVGLLLPTTKQMCAILAIPPIVNNEQVQELPQKVLDLGLSLIDDLTAKGE